MKEYRPDIKWLEHYEGFRVMEGLALPQPLTLRIPKPTLAEKFQAFVILLRAIQGRLDTTPINRSTGDICGGEYDDD